MHPAYVPILYGLASLRVVSPVWPVDDFYCRFSAGTAGVIELRSELVDYVDLLTHDLAYLATVGRLAVAWSVSLVPRLSGLGDTTFVLEPSADAPGLDEIARDLQTIGATLAARIRRLARVRLFCLGGPTDAPRIDELTPREGEVLDLLLSGLGTTTIARQLFVSPHTVRNHLKHVCAKLGVSSQRELRELFAPR